MNRELNFLNSPIEILHALIISKQTGSSVGISSTALGGETFVTAVEDLIFEEDATVVVLKHYDSAGYILPFHKINLLEIQGVCPLNTQFVNPYVNKITKNKSWYF